MRRDKPRLTATTCRLWYRIVRYVREYADRYRRNPEDLPHAASDVMDGLCLGHDPEVQELLLAGLIERVKCREYSTWHLTEYGCRVMRSGDRRVLV